jgi:hypothetical protein
MFRATCSDCSAHSSPWLRSRSGGRQKRNAADPTSRDPRRYCDDCLQEDTASGGKRNGSASDGWKYVTVEYIGNSDVDDQNTRFWTTEDHDILVSPFGRIVRRQLYGPFRTPSKTRDLTACTKGGSRKALVSEWRKVNSRDIA